MTNEELVALVRVGGPYQGKAVLELIDRAQSDDAAVEALATVAQLSNVQTDRIFHLVSLAWAAITGLLATERPGAREHAYRAFAALSERDRRDLLVYLRVVRVEDAHPAKP
jgi:hypothetical protein